MKTLMLTLAVVALTACRVIADAPDAVCDAGTSGDAGEAAVAIPDGGAGPAEGPLESAELPSFPDRLPSSPYHSSALAVPLSAVPLQALLRGADHIRTVALDPQSEGGWADAQLLPRAIPIYRPDVGVPVAYELKLERAGASAGFVTVSLDNSAAPVSAYSTVRPTRVEQLFARAAAAGASVARVYQLDAVHLVAEDAAGTAVAAEPDEYLKVAVGTAGVPPTFEYGTAADWPMVKSRFASAAQPWLDSQRNGFAEGWVGEDQALGRRQSQFASLAALVSVTLTQPVPVREFTVVYDAGGQRYRCDEVRAASPLPASLDQLTPAWNQIGMDFQHPKSGSSATCASGCTPLAFGIVMGWMDRMGTYGRNPYWNRPDLRRAFFRYRDPVAPSTLAGPLSDRSRYEYLSGAPYSWVGQSLAEPGPGTSQPMDMRRYLSELSSTLETRCDGLSGSTGWNKLPAFGKFLTDHGLPVAIHAGSNPFGESGFRDNVIDRLKRHGAPGVINIDLSQGGHTVTIVASRQCTLEQRDADGNWAVVGTPNPFLYANFGWGGANNHWMAVGNLKSSAVFDPVTTVLLTVNGAGRSVHASTSAVVTPAVAKAANGNVFEVMGDLLVLDPVGDGSQYLRRALAGSCLNAGLNKAVGTALTFAPCAGGAYQRFTPWLLQSGVVMLYHPFSNHCVGAADDGDGAALQLKSCSAGDPNQLFAL